MGAQSLPTVAAATLTMTPPTTPTTTAYPAHGSVVAEVALGSKAEGLAYAFGSLWVTNPDAGRVSRVDPATRKVIATIPVAGMPIPIAASKDAVWVGSYASGKLSRIDPSKNKVVATADVFGGNPSSINVVGDELWVGGHGINGAQIFGLDSMESSQNVTIGPAPGFAVVDGSTIWYPCYGGTTIARVDIASHAVTATSMAARAPSTPSPSPGQSGSPTTRRDG
jgi:YVTN family beta-propeller protein